MLDGVPSVTTPESEGRLRVTVQSFIHRVIVRAAKRLPKNCDTSRDGLKYVSYDVDRTYRVMQRDFKLFARLVTEELRNIDLRDRCAMSVVRFYNCEHGMRLEKNQAQQVIHQRFRIDHPHAELIQLHRADTISFADGGAVLVKVSGRAANSLNELLSESIKLAKTNRYRAAFTLDYGYFDHSSSPAVHENIVTFAQAYSSAAKLGRPSDFGSIPAFLICHSYIDGDRQRVTLRKFRSLSKDTRQYIRDSVSYIWYYVRSGHKLRVEEVLTFDRLRLPYGMSAAFDHYGVFDNDSRCITSDLLLQHGLLYRIENEQWQNHVDVCIVDDLLFLMSIAMRTCQGIDSDGWILTSIIRRSIRAQFRCLYFVHGSSRHYNYETMRHIFVNRNELESVNRGIITLRPFHDDTDTFAYPLYSKMIKQHHMSAIRHIWYAICGIEEAIENIDEEIYDEFDNIHRCIRYVITIFASWSYRKTLVGRVEQDAEDIKAISSYIYTNYETAFSLNTFLEECENCLEENNNILARISGVLDPEEIVRDILEPCTPFTQVARMTCRVSDIEEFKIALLDFVTNHVDIFPVGILGRGKRFIYGWRVVRKHDRTARQITVDHVKRQIRSIRHTGSHFIEIEDPQVDTESSSQESIVHEEDPLVQKEDPAVKEHTVAEEDALDPKEVLDQKIDQQLLTELEENIRRTRTGRRYGGPLLPQENPPLDIPPSNASTSDESLVIINETLANRNRRTVNKIESSSESDQEFIETTADSTLNVEVDDSSSQITTSSSIRFRRKRRSNVLSSSESEPTTVDPNSAPHLPLNVCIRVLRSRTTAFPGTAKFEQPSCFPYEEKKDKMIIKVKHFNPEQDEALLRHAIDRDSISNLHTWLCLKQKRNDIFGTEIYTPSRMRHRVSQISAGMHNSDFEQQYKQELKILRKLVRSQAKRL